ncbi:uncharacterized protein [Rutidosis leptorrhynchoides]|uniref:uncharacterized protein n=1 Tax=Rutidosis leptorrhynchoides TaxID=125765 RepID=UPI003A9961B7
MESTTSNFSHLQIPLEEVLKATNNFDKKNVIGQGELGKVYKGKLLRSEKWVKIAARRLDSKHKRRIEFLTEISALSSLQHENIVSIIGFCDENDEKVIINEYLAKGSLEMHLSKPSLTWVQRLKICIGVARALSYIHFEDGRGSCVIHRNINSSTILLNNKLEPKLSGFEYSVKQSVHRIDQVFIKETIGTKGYVDPAIEMTGGVTYKSDVYSFGVVLWEVLYGRKAFISDEFDRFLTPLARFHFENKTPNVIPPVLNDQLGMESARILKDAAYSCSNDEREERPSLKTINNVLERALELQLQHQSLYRANLEDLTSQLSHLKIRLADINSAKFYHRAKFYDVYRAELQQWNKKNSATVFIKRLCPREDKTREDVFATDIEMLTTCKHPNIVTLVGFCDEDDEKILVIEDAPNGYLIDYLVKDNDKDMSLLSWEKRLKICLDVAYGLKYLHYEMDDQKTVINGDFTTMSIALDENFVAKIVDFGFSMFLPPNQDSLHVKLVRGSKFYIDPEYAGGGVLTRASDVYTFGVILFEVLCGRMASHEMYLKESEVGLVYVARRCFLDGTLTDIIDPIIKEASDDNNLIITKGPDKDSLDTFVNLAYQCVATVQRARPTMEFIVEELEKALSFQAKARCQQHSDQVVDGVDHLTLANSVTLFFIYLCFLIYFSI